MKGGESEGYKATISYHICSPEYIYPRMQTPPHQPLQSCPPQEKCTTPSSAPLRRLIVPQPQLLNLTLKPLHIIQDIARITPRLRHRLLLGAFIFLVLMGRVQRILTVGAFFRRRGVFVAQGAFARHASAPLAVEACAAVFRAGAPALGGRCGGDVGALVVETGAVGLAPARGRWGRRHGETAGAFV